MGGSESRSTATEPVIAVDAGLTEALEAQRTERETVEAQVDFDERVSAEVERQVLEAKAKWEAERLALVEAHADELRAAEAQALDDVSAKVDDLRAKYDFLRPPPEAKCVDEDKALALCYATASRPLDCADKVLKYTECAKLVANQLA